MGQGQHPTLYDIFSRNLALIDDFILLASNWSLKPNYLLGRLPIIPHRPKLTHSFPDLIQAQAAFFNPLPTCPLTGC